MKLNTQTIWACFHESNRLCSPDCFQPHILLGGFAVFFTVFSHHGVEPCAWLHERQRECTVATGLWAGRFLCIPSLSETHTWYFSFLKSLAVSDNSQRCELMTFMFLSTIGGKWEKTLNHWWEINAKSAWGPPPTHKFPPTTVCGNYGRKRLNLFVLNIFLCEGENIVNAFPRAGRSSGGHTDTIRGKAFPSYLPVEAQCMSARSLYFRLHDKIRADSKVLQLLSFVLKHAGNNAD